MTSIRRYSHIVAGVLVGLVLSTQAIAQADPPGYDQRKANVARGASGAALAAASQAGPAATVRGYLRARGASDATVNSLRETGANTTRAGVTHLRMEQQVAGLTVYGRTVKAAVNARGELVNLIENVAPVPTTPLAEPRINAQRALQAAMARVHPGMQPDLGPSGSAGNTSTFAGGAFFAHDPSVTRVAIPLADGSMEIGYLVETWTARDNQLHHTLVSGDGRVLNVELRTARDSYNVFTIDPLKTPQAIVAGPAPSATAPSPIGWLGSGAQSTWAISGNNAFAYLDADANNRPDRGGTTVTNGSFVTPASLGTQPSTTNNRAVAVQNLFYLNNVIHDVLYTHGFDEAAGNFQQDNFGKGGSGSDPVQAEAQDGSGTDNANFATPGDGRPPRMQMYLWTGAGATHLVHVNAPSQADYGAMGADFGPALTSTGITGGLVATTAPADGCTAISTPLAGKVALIDRGTCEFSTKALNAQNAGATAVIIANNQGGTAIFTMAAGSVANRVRIPAVMVSQDAGAALRKTGASNVTVRRPATQPLMIDSALDSDVVFHEYAHGLTWRMIGGMSGPLAGAIGEGMSDGIAMLVNGDDVIGEYSSSSPLGIRRYPYKNYPLTYKDVTGAEVHDDGEPIAAIVWQMIELFGKNGREQLFGYVVDGMNYTPPTPAYEDIRDGILAAIRNAQTDTGNACSLVWRAFAQFGVGVGAQGTVLRDGTVQVTESYTQGTCP